MLSEMQDRDAIISNAIKIASPEVRQAYISGACGNDAALRRQVEELVTEHFQGGSTAKPAVTAARDPRPHRAGLDHAGANHHSAAGEIPEPRTLDIHWDLDKEPMEARKMGQKQPRGLMTVWALLLLPATVGGAGVTMWKMRADEPSAATLQQAVEERDQALKAKAEAQKQLDQAVAARQTLESERDAALAAAKAARRSEKARKIVLAFLRDKLLSVSGNPSSWSGSGLGKDVTLRKAVDAAEAKVAEAFVDRPLVEASIRQIFGSTYLALGEAERSVRQYERALALLEQDELGANSPETGDCRNQLAVALRRANRPDAASRLFENIPNHKKGRETKNGQNPVRGQNSSPQGNQSLADENKLFEDS